MGEHDKAVGTNRFKLGAHANMWHGPYTPERLHHAKDSANGGARGMQAFSAPTRGPIPLRAAVFPGAPGANKKAWALAGLILACSRMPLDVSPCVGRANKRRTAELTPPS